MPNASHTVRSTCRICFGAPFQQYVRPVTTPPAGSDVLEDWIIMWELAKRLTDTLVFDGVELDLTASRPGSDDMLALLSRHGQAPFEQIRAAPGGTFVDIEQLVEPADPATAGRFQVLPSDVADEMSDLSAEPGAPQHHWRDGRQFSHTLASRRMREVFDTYGRQLSTIQKRRPYNPAYLHPEDLLALGLVDGDQVWIESSHGKITAIVESDSTVKPGVISMAHGWGRNPGEDTEIAENGSCTGMLIADPRPAPHVGDSGAHLPSRAGRTRRSTIGKREKRAMSAIPEDHYGQP